MESPLPTTNGKTMAQLGFKQDLLVSLFELVEKSQTKVEVSQLSGESDKFIHRNNKKNRWLAINHTLSVPFETLSALARIYRTVAIIFLRISVLFLQSQ